MKIKLKHVLSVAVAAMILVGAASVAFAQNPTTGQDATMSRKDRLGRRSPGMGGFMLGYIKGKTNVDVRTLLDALKSGKTPEEIASGYGLDLAALKEEIARNRPKAVFEGLDKETAAILCYIARKANVGVETLVNEYKGGKSLEDIAKEHGLELSAVKAAIKAVRPPCKGDGVMKGAGPRPGPGLRGGRQKGGT